MSVKTKAVSLMLVVGLLSIVAAGEFEQPISRTGGQSITKPSADFHFASSETNKFRLANFNIQKGKGKDGIRDLSRAASVMQGADIIALQELSGTLYYGLHNQAQQLGEALGLGYLFAPAMTKWFQPYDGNGLLSRFQVIRWQVEPLPHGDGASGGYRNLLTAELNLGGQLVTLLITHLDRRDLNETQLAFVLNRFRQTPSPVVLLGDLNTDRDDPQIRQLLAEPGNQDAIFAAIGEFWRLDWIITRGFRVLSGGYAPRGISDHAYYWLDVELEPPALENAPVNRAAGVLN